MHLLDLIEQELRAYRETGQAMHLAHAARALDQARMHVLRELKARPGHVERHQTSRE
jgi:cell division protein ZapA (FtsZ GTPase activity inhibitor)